MSGSVCMTYCDSVWQCNSYWRSSDLLCLSEIVTHLYGKRYLYTEQLVHRDHWNEEKKDNLAVWQLWLHTTKCTVLHVYILHC